MTNKEFEIIFDNAEVNKQFHIVEELAGKRREDLSSFHNYKTALKELKLMIMKAK